MSSTFSGFNIAKSGIQTAQANLNITGQNMANISTKGYTRQRLDTYAVGTSTTNMRYASGDPGIGEGVEIQGASQIRDPYLDVRYRMENAKVGDTSAQLQGLDDLENIFDETTNDGLEAQFKDLVSQLQTLSGSPTDTVTQNIVKTSSLLLVQAFNNDANQINQIRDEQVNSLENNDISKVNDLINSITHINSEIKSSNISGNPALELTDQRNQMIDELSQYVNIQVSSNTVPIGSGNTVSELSIDMVSGGQKFNLVDDNEGRQFSLVKDASGTVTFPVTIELKNADGTAVTSSNDGSVALTNGNVNDCLTSGTLGGALKQLNGKGNFATGSESTERGIDYYENMLNRLAQSFADMMNKVNSTATDSYNKPLFTQTDGTTTAGITAANISLSSAWENADGNYITTSKNDGQAGSNVLYMINQFSTKQTYTTDGTDTGKAFFNGTFQECVSNISSTLGLQIQDVKRQNTTYQSTLDDIDTQRSSNSSVDINEEGINLITYNQALEASSRLMTTLDEALDTIINKMGITGT